MRQTWWDSATLEDAPTKEQLKRHEATILASAEAARRVSYRPPSGLYLPVQMSKHPPTQASYIGWLRINLLDIKFAFFDGVAISSVFDASEGKTSGLLTTSLEFLQEHSDAYGDHRPEAAAAGIISHMTRCGSTMAARMFAALPKTFLVLSDISVMTAVLSSAVNRGVALVTMRSIFSLYAAAAPGRKIIIHSQFTPIESPGGEDAGTKAGGGGGGFSRYYWGLEAFGPNVPWIFITRDPKKVLQSNLRRPPSWLIGRGGGGSGDSGDGGYRKRQGDGNITLAEVAQVMSEHVALKVEATAALLFGGNHAPLRSLPPPQRLRQKLIGGEEEDAASSLVKIEDGGGIGDGISGIGAGLVVEYEKDLKGSVAGGAVARHFGVAGLIGPAERVEMLASCDSHSKARDVVYNPAADAIVSEGIAVLVTRELPRLQAPYDKLLGRWQQWQEETEERTRDGGVSWGGFRFYQILVLMLLCFLLLLLLLLLLRRWPMRINLSVWGSRVKRKPEIRSS